MTAAVEDLGDGVRLKAHGAKVTEKRSGVSPDRASGERRPTVARRCVSGRELWAVTPHLAEWFPNTRITAFSMSKSEIEAIRGKAAKRTLSNVVLVVGDMTTY